MYTSMYIHMYMCVYVSEGSEFDRYTLFFVLWALKEAYIKAIGIGLGYELKQVYIHSRSVCLYTKRLCVIPLFCLKLVSIYPILYMYMYILCYIYSYVSTSHTLSALPSQTLPCPVPLDC